MARPPPRPLTDFVAGAVFFLDQIGKIVPIVGLRHLSLGDAQASLKILTDAVCPPASLEATLGELPDPPRGEPAPLGRLLIHRIHVGDEGTLFAGQLAQVKGSSCD